MVAYERVVRPMLTLRIDGPDRRAQVDKRLAGWALQGGYLVVSYARLVGLTGVEDIAVVAGSFMRLYDDVLDEREDGPTVGSRLAQLFSGDEIEPASDVEAVVVDLYQWLALRVSPYHRDALYAYLNEVHEIQLEELDAGAVDPRYIINRTVRKGGAGMAILAGLANPRIEPGEFELLQRLGAVLQLVDDYDDEFEDRGTMTSATTAAVTFSDLALRLRAVSAEILATYGRRRGRSFVDGLYIWLLIVGTRRQLDRIRPRRLDDGEGGSPRRLLSMLSVRKVHIR
jgi:hypothetical protein